MANKWKKTKFGFQIPTEPRLKVMALKEIQYTRPLFVVAIEALKTARQKCYVFPRRKNGSCVLDELAASINYWLKAARIVSDELEEEIKNALEKTKEADRD